MDFFNTKPRRKNFSKSIKDAVLKLQNNKCKMCGKRFTSLNKAQFDHKNGKDTDNTFKNCQALHAGCHDVKSRRENKKRNKKPRNNDFGFNVDNIFGGSSKKTRKSPSNKNNDFGFNVDNIFGTTKKKKKRKKNNETPFLFWI